MAEYKATIIWERGTQLFTDNRYSRAHKWRFDGGIEVQASSSPQVVPFPYSDAHAIDPEEALWPHYQAVICFGFFLLQQRTIFVLTVTLMKLVV